GEIKPVGGVPAKIEAAQRAGLKRVLIPRGNWQERFANLEAEIIPIDELEEAISLMLCKTSQTLPHEDNVRPLERQLVAKGVD
ncbi:MAG TPA: ATP-dependent protease LonB, partial [Clostridia bacterium]|nr:ATP-dependent protease LonB [Clostridia bacterium]